MLHLDHIAICAATLQEGVEHVESALGLPLGPGGKHALFATHNRLMGLAGGLYLEVIAPDPEAEPQRARWFGLDHWQGPPRLANWICGVPDLAAAMASAPPEAGEALDLQRGANRWRIAVPEDGSLPLGGAFPTLIEWITAPVGPRLPTSGAGLTALRIESPQAAAALAALGPLPAPITLRPGPAFAMQAEIATSHGPRILT